MRSRISLRVVIGADFEEHVGDRKRLSHKLITHFVDFVI